MEESASHHLKEAISDALLRGKTNNLTKNSIGNHGFHGKFRCSEKSDFSQIFGCTFQLWFSDFQRDVREMFHSKDPLIYEQHWENRKSFANKSLVP